MYYRLRDDPGARRRGLRVAVIATQPELDLPWRMGTRFVAPVPAPIRCTLDARGGPDLPDAFLSKRIPLFSERLVEALRAAGVDNLDCYDAEVRSPDGSRVVAKYFATNIVGKVQCADRAASSIDARSDYPMFEFNRLVIDERLTGDARLFRLAENPSYILVADSVVRALEPTPWVGVQFVPLDQQAVTDAGTEQR